MIAGAIGPGIKAALLTTVALLAFAGNSIIARAALGDAAIDPLSYTAIRLIGGAVALLLYCALSGRLRSLKAGINWISTLSLFLYAVLFSIAYVGIATGTGALILFGAVQATMIGAGLLGGGRPGRREWLGWLLACGGMAWLLLPGVTAPQPFSAAMMALAGIAWGVYSLQGKSAAAPLAANAASFTLALLPMAVVLLLGKGGIRLSGEGIWLALLSGAITSGIGYVIWYAALEYLAALQAALVQLTVPVIAAFGGILLLGESLSARLLVATVLVLGGIAIALTRK